MATTFDKQEKARETTPAHDQELNFRILLRRNKLLADWAAGQMNLPTETRRLYAAAVGASMVQNPSDDHLIRKIQQDLQQANIEVPLHKIEKELATYTEAARKQIMAEMCA